MMDELIMGMGGALRPLDLRFAGSLCSIQGRVWEGRVIEVSPQNGYGELYVL